MAAAKKAATATIENPTVEIAALRLQQTEITLVGTEPLIVHAWSEKAKKEMLDKQMKTGSTSTGRQAKNPRRDFLDSRYMIEDGDDDDPSSGIHGFPILAFKAAVISACSQAGKNITKVAARSAFHLINGVHTDRHGVLVPLRFSDIVMREDMVKVGMGTADIRHRAEYKNWEVDLIIKWNTSVLSIAQIIGLFNLAGFGVGIGEWRPSAEKSGMYGTFEVKEG